MESDRGSEDINRVLSDDEIHSLVQEDTLVRDFLVQLRSVDLGCCTISPTFIFAVTIVLFFLPGIWGIASTMIDAELPPTVFFDGCRNGSGNAIKHLQEEYKWTVTNRYQDCVVCNGNKPFVYTNATSVGVESRLGFAIIVIVFNVVVTLIGTVFFIRLSLKEFTALYLMGFDVLVEAHASARTIGMVVFVVLLCLAAAAINVAYAIYLTMSLDNIPLGWKPNATAIAGECFPEAGRPAGTHLFATFKSDNPSTSAAVRPHDPISIVKAVLSASLLYVPLISKLAILVGRLFNSFNVQDLMERSRITSKIFGELKYSVDYEDLLAAIYDYASVRDPEECSCKGCCGRLFSLSWNCCKPPALMFGWSWGIGSLKDINAILTIVSRRGQLRPYTEEEYHAEASRVFEDGGAKKQGEENEGEDQKNPLAAPTSAVADAGGAAPPDDAAASAVPL